MTPSRQQHPGIWALAVTAFAIGVAEFIVVGVLPAIATDLDVPLAQAGGLVGLYALALAIGTPLVVLGLARFPGKPVLLGLIAVFLIGNLLSAMSYSYAMLLAGRIMTAIAHGSFGPWCLCCSLAAGEIMRHWRHGEMKKPPRRAVSRDAGRSVTPAARCAFSLP